MRFSPVSSSVFSRSFSLVALAASALLLVTGCEAQSPAQAATDASETRPEVMVATANPLATQAGLNVLKAGGSAVDAAIAIEAVLSLVEPQSSGLAGGAFMMHFDSETKTLTAYDGREISPKSAARDMFLVDGERMSYLDAKHSGLSTGVPGIIAMFQMAHSEHGTLPWADLFAGAKTLATDGFEVSPRLNFMINRFGKYLPKTPVEGPVDAYAYFHTEAGEPLPVGHVLKNADYAASLDIIAADPDAFYTGAIAEEIVAQVNTMPRGAGMTMEDLAAYTPLKKEALCAPYRDMQLCGPPPASSWVAVGEIMKLVAEAEPFTDGGAANHDNWTAFVNAQRLSYADRDRYVADPASVDVPVAGLLADGYIKERAAAVTTDTVAPAEPGDPWAFENSKTAWLNGRDATPDIAGTTHFVVVDADGDVVSITATVESIFGSGRMAGGMFLNNQLTDFSFLYEDGEGRAIANAVAPHKRPRSSMSPTIVLDNKGDFKLATGSPGGSNIIAYTAKSLIGVLDWGLSPQEAVALPNVVARGETVRVEANTGSEALIADLEAKGFTVDGSRGENSGLSMIMVGADGKLVGGVDPRREGVVGQ